MGSMQTGSIEASDEKAAVNGLRARRLCVVSIQPSARKRLTALRNGGLGLIRKRVTTRDLSLFCRQFATVMDAGIPVLTSLDILARQAENVALKAAVEDVAAQLQTGKTLAEAMRKQHGVFPGILTSMIEAGEVGGVLDLSLARMAGHFEREHEIREKVKAAMTYPLILSVIGILAVGFLVTFVLPNFISIFTSAGATVPLPTRVLMGLSGFLRQFWYLILVAAVAAGWGGRHLLELDGVRCRFDGWLLRMPVFGPLLSKVAISRFCRTLSTLLSTGVPLLDALDVVKGTAGNVVIAGVAERARDSVREGRDLAGPLGESAVIPPMVSRMVGVGEETGALDVMLEKVAQFYDREVNIAVGRLSAMLEPVLLVGMGIMVGAVIIAILLPMLSVISGAGVGM